MLGALLSGLLTLVSLCSALLLPSFFAFAFERVATLLARNAVFYLGLAAVLVPLGDGVGAVGSLLTGYRDTVTQIGGIVLIVSAAGGSAAYGGLLMGTYALGMAVPLFIMALIWDRLHLGRRRWLRGRTLTIGPFTTHTTNLISGLLFTGIGILFLTTDGTPTSAASAASTPSTTCRPGCRTPSVPSVTPPSCSSWPSPCWLL